MTDSPSQKVARNLDDFSGMASDWFWETDSDHRFCYFSRRIEEVTRFDIYALLGKRRDVIPNEKLSDPKWVAHLDDLANHRSFRDFEYKMRRPHDGTLLWVRIAGEPQFDDLGQFSGYRGVGHDVTGEKLAIERLEASNQELAKRNRELDQARKTIERSAYQDPLTELSNRRAFEHDLEGALHQTDATLGLLHVDLDRFKWVNDSLGHPAGDQVLKTVAERLQTTVQNNGHVYRVGGDEFMVILPPPTTTELAMKLGADIVSSLEASVTFGIQQISVGASIGVAVTKTDDTNVQQLVSHADVALYEAKRNGRNTVCFSTAQMQARVEDERCLAADIPGAIARHEFVPYFQPQFDIRSRMVIGVEALVRWQHPKRGLLAPGAFLRVATELGIVDQIDRLLLEASLAVVDRLSQRGYALPSLSVNVSEARLVGPQLCDDVDRLWRDRRCQLAVELLETIDFDNKGNDDRLSQNMQRLREMGVRIETDDFGSGRASITGLLRIAPDRIKIDRDLVQKVVSSPRQRSLVITILDMARALDIDCIAEGVETQADIDAMTKIGCHLFQGFAVCHPLNEQDLGHYLATQDIAPTHSLHRQRVDPFYIPKSA